MDLIKRSKYRCISTREAQPLMQSPYCRFKELHESRFGTMQLTPKWAWMPRFIERLSEKPWMFDMFYVERLHQSVRPHAELHCNTTNFEKGVLMRILDEQICSENTAASSALIGKQTAVPIAGVDYTVSSACSAHGMEVHCDDVVSCGSQMAVVRGCLLRHDDRAFAVKVELCRHVRDDIWRHKARIAWWDLRHAAAWRAAGEHLLCILHTREVHAV